MDGGQIDALIESVRRVEKGYAFWRVIAVGGAAMVASLLIFAVVNRAGAPEAVVARDFIVVDENGRALIRLGSSGEMRGKACLQFLDGKGKRRIVIGVDNDDWAHIALLDPDAKDELVLDMKPRNGPTITFRNPSNRSGLVLTTDATGVAAVGFIGKNGNHVLELGVNPGGSGRLTLYSNEGRKLFEVPEKEQR